MAPAAAFFGILSDGNPHVLAVSVYNADSYFLATANLLVFTDHGSARVTGGLLSSTLTAAPTPVVAQHIQVNPSGPTYTGSIQVSSHRQFAISGYVDTSHGRVQTTLEQSVNYLNRQEFDVSPSTDIQNVQQSSSVDARTTRSGTGLQVREQHFSYPLSINFAFIVNPDGSLTQTTTSEQRDLERDFSSGAHAAGSTLSNEVRAADTLSYDANGNFLGPSGSKTTHSYRSRDANGHCYGRTLTAQAQKLIAVSGAGCEDD